MALTVLIAEDEQMIRDSVSAYLQKQGCRTLPAGTGREALALFEREAVGFVILDLMLPDLPGEEVCAALRRRSTVPVLMLTAKSAEEDILNGLRIGADDYVTKPFSLKQLYARMEAILRRAGNDLRPLAETFTWNENELYVDFEHREIRRQGEALSLTPSEWKILSALVRHPKKVYTRSELIELVFGPDFDSYERVIDTHVKNLRKKVEPDPKSPRYIQTVHGLGYKFGGGQP